MNSNGCDSTVVLDLTINSSSIDTILATACDFYLWDGVTYNTTGLYTNLYSFFRNTVVNISIIFSLFFSNILIFCHQCLTCKNASTILTFVQVFCGRENKVEILKILAISRYFSHL